VLVGVASRRHRTRERDRYLTEDWTDMDSGSYSGLSAATTLARRVAVVGACRLGTSLTAALRGVTVDGPPGREPAPAGDLDEVLA
jgi:hypothetical protein